MIAAPMINLVTMGVLAFVLAQSAPHTVIVTGVVEDQTGAVLPGAAVTLSGGPTAMQQATTDPNGVFRFERIAPGEYDIRTEFPGFAPTATHLRVGTRAPSPLTIVLAIEGVTQEVSVSGGSTETSTAAESNLNAIAVSADQLDDLPVLDQDIVGAMSRFLDATAIGTNGPTVLMNGVEVNVLALSASAVQQVKINQDPYSAEFMRPGRGRIDIITKPGGQEYSGTVNLRFRFGLRRPQRVRDREAARTAAHRRGDAGRAARYWEEHELSALRHVRRAGQPGDRLCGDAGRDGADERCDAVSQHPGGRFGDPPVRP